MLEALATGVLVGLFVFVISLLAGRSGGASYGYGGGSISHEIERIERRFKRHERQERAWREERERMVKLSFGPPAPRRVLNPEEWKGSEEDLMPASEIPAPNGIIPRDL